MSSEAPLTVNYEPLPSRAIRLFRLQPAKKLTAPLIGTLEVVSLDDELQYEALSYAWDGAFNQGQSMRDGESWQEAIPLPRGRMYLEECLTSITGNLRDALRRLRHDSQTRLLWIDALCICQDDRLEQSAQVAIMAEIYSTANRVIVWLGEDSDAGDGELYFRLCRKYPQRINSVGRRIVGRLVSGVEIIYSTSKGYDWNYWMAQKSVGPMYCLRAGERVSLLKTFAQRRYFHRKWCVQEVAVAKDLVVLCGTHQLPWNKLVVEKFTFNWTLLFGNCFVGLDSVRERPADALGTLQNTTTMHCSDERDYIYALATLLSRDAQCPAIVVNYTIPWQQVYTSFVGNFLQSSALPVRWELLSSVAGQWEAIDERQIRSVDLPSWVLDLRREFNRELHRVHLIDSEIGRMTVRGGVLETQLVYCGKSSDKYEFRLANRWYPSDDDDCLYSLAADMFEYESEYSRYLALRPVADRADTFRLVGLAHKSEEAEKTREAGEVHKIFII